MNAIAIALAPIAALFLAAAPAGRPGGQEELAITYYRPEHVDAGRLAAFLNELYHGEGVFGDWVREEGLTVMPIGVSVMVAAPDERLVDVLAVAKRADREYAETREVERAPELAVRDYQVKYTTVESLRRALEPFRHTVTVTDPDTGEWYETQSITLVPERNAIVLRDTPPRTAEVLALLSDIDVPEEQVLWTYHLVQGAGADGGEGVPADLARDLARLVPEEHFALVSFGMLRSSALAPVTLMGTLEPAGHLRLSLVPEAFDAEQGTLTLRSCELKLERAQGERRTEHEFATRASVDPDQYTVLGGVGADPYYLVLRLQRLGREGL